MSGFRGETARLAALAAAVAVTAVISTSGQTSSGQNTSQQKPPVFRTEANYVHVDAYPARDGKIIEGLTAADFEVLEDGKPQTIDAVQFIRFDPFTSDAERRDPNSQREAFQLASDPRYRVFVIYLDMYHTSLTGSHDTRKPLVAMLNRVIGPRDLFGMLTPHQRPRDLVLGQHTEMIAEQLERHWTWAWDQANEEELELSVCGMGEGSTVNLIPRRRLDKVFSDLEGLVDLLGGIRQERKNILFFSGGWRLPSADPSLRNVNKNYTGPPIGVTPAGKLTLGGRAGEPNETWCQNELNRLAEMDFNQRLRDLIRLARRTNVAFYTINPQGLEPNAVNERTDHLVELATNTDGVAVINTNDLNPGLARITNDLSAYYVLGYYTTNTKWDGGLRKITVRLKPGGTPVRARREYRAPTEAEMTTMRAALSAPKEVAAPSPVDAAFSALSRMRPEVPLLAHGAVVGNDLALVAEIAAPAIEAGRWKSGADVNVTVSDASGAIVATATGRIEPGARAAIVRVPIGSQEGPWVAAAQVRASGEEEQHDRVRVARPAGPVGDALVYRATPAAASPLRPAAVFQFRRTERIHVEWPILQPLDRRAARLLGRNGAPLALEITMSERTVNGAGMLAADLNLAPLTAGDYAIDLIANHTRRVFAFRVVR